MRDIAIMYPTSDDYDWDLDIDIIDGNPRYVEAENQTQDQRAALAALISKGTIPGSLATGIDWGRYITDSSSLIAIDNQVKQQISSLAAIGTDTQMTSYIPVYQSSKKGGIDVRVYRAQ